MVQMIAYDKAMVLYGFCMKEVDFSQILFLAWSMIVDPKTDFFKYHIWLMAKDG